MYTVAIGRGGWRYRGLTIISSVQLHKLVACMCTCMLMGE